MSKTLIIISLLLLSGQVHSKDCIVLLHGLARSADSMEELEEKLAASHYRVVNQGYDSRSATVEQLSLATIPKAIKACGTTDKIHFVTHSMGGIIARYYLSQHTIPNLGRVVMLGPPNKGSEVVDKMGEFSGFEFMNGPAGLQLGTGTASIPSAIGPAKFDLGIIAGNKSINLILSSQIPGPDDGKVSIESTKLDGMKDHIVMSTTHTFMMDNNKVIAQVLYYLEHGEFERSNAKGK